MKSINIKRDKTELKIDINKINMFVGANGVGKTLLNKCIWYMSFLASSYEKFKDMLGLDDEAFSRIYKIYFNQTFFDSENFNVELEVEYENGVIFKVYHENDKLIFLPPENFKNLNLPTPIYCSTETRLFTNLERVGKMTHASIKETDRVEDLDYPLYDFMFSEQMKHRLSERYEVTEQLSEILEKYLKFKIKSFEYSDDAYWYIDEDGNKKRLRTLSNGEQSIIMLFLANHP